MLFLDCILREKLLMITSKSTAAIETQHSKDINLFTSPRSVQTYVWKKIINQNTIKNLLIQNVHRHTQQIDENECFTLHP